MPAKQTSKPAKTKASPNPAKAVKPAVKSVVKSVPAPTPKPTAKPAVKTVAKKIAPKPAAAMLKPVVDKKTAPVPKPVKAPVAVETAPRKKAPEKASPSPTAPPPIQRHEIETRAYFIAERRNLMGWPGSSATDWIEAESQLIAEARRRKNMAG